MKQGHNLARSLRAAYLAMHRRTNAILEQHRVTADQYVLLACLADGDSINQQELARRASSDPNTIRPMLLLLEKRGLIRRQAHPSDRRAHCVVLTASGRREFRGMFRDTEQCRRQILSAVKFGSAERLAKNLMLIAERLREF